MQNLSRALGCKTSGALAGNASTLVGMVFVGVSSRLRACFLVGVVCIALMPAKPATADSGKCGSAVVAEASRYAQARARILAWCEDRILTGKLAPGTDCADEPVVGLRIQKAAAKLRAGIDRACGGGDRSCGVGGDDVDLVAAGWGIGSCPDFGQSGCTLPIDDCGDVAACVECLGDASTVRALHQVVGEMDLAPSRSREVLGCQRAATKHFGKLFSIRAKHGARCWGKVFKGKANAPCPFPGDGRTDGLLETATDKFIASVCRACGGGDRECDEEVGTVAGSGSNDDLPLALIGAGSVCADWTDPVSGESCGGPVATVSDFADCLRCTAAYSTACVELATVPSEAVYPAACNDAVPTPTPTPVPTPTPPPGPTPTPNPNGSDHFVDELNGNDTNSGTDVSSPWRTLQRVSASTFEPGDRILFKRGTSYSGCVTIEGDGSQSAPITISAYGTGDAPRFTNPDPNECSGNAMRIRGDHHVVEGLHFHDTAPAPDDSGFQRVWAAGALHVGLGHDHVVIRNNEFARTPKAIQSYSQYSLITQNYIHDTNPAQSNGMLSDPYWGPIGIQLGIGNQEVSHNTIENMYVVDGQFGADGGAIEVDDGRNHKDNIHIHHNQTSRNMGFLEISWWDDLEKMASNNVSVHHNISRDYQSFVLWWAPTAGSAIENNTIIRTDNQYTGPFDGVFFIDAPPGDIRLTKNIIVTDKDLTEAVFVEGFDGGVDDVDHFDNLYWDVVDGNVDLGLPLGPGEVFADPLFIDWAGGDYRLQPGSPAVGWGALPGE
jgi:hypothetical protein